MRVNSLIFLAITLCVLPNMAYATNFDASTLSLYWGVPFLGVLFSIALLPLCCPHLWHQHFGKIILGWTGLFVIAFAYQFDTDITFNIIAHALLQEYIPFILLLLALFTVAGGILIRGKLKGTPGFNLLLLIIGTLLASIMGTTGAAMLMIRPLIKANEERKQHVHIIIFFIFLVANIGGGLTPLGDPPLFIGFLKGIDFFWTVNHMMLPVLFNTILLLILFYVIDRHFYQKMNSSLDHVSIKSIPSGSFTITGKINIILLIAIIVIVLLSSVWQTERGLLIYGNWIPLSNIVCDVILMIIILISIKLTPKAIRTDNEFNWQPIIEVAKLFIGIFITIVPVLEILKAGLSGNLSTLVALVTDSNGEPINTMYFWLSGMLSSFLDNAPTYLVFFNLASGDPQILMYPLQKTLLAISMGSVFMGALTYIGNAPNFMIRSIAEQSKIIMPNFFSYMKWSFSILIPLFMLDMLIFIV